MKPLQRERSVTFEVGAGFYRPKSRIVRDLGVLAAAVYQAQNGSLRVLDGLSATGVRSLRYCHEAKADWVWANEGNPDLCNTLKQNLATLLPDKAEVSSLNVHHLCMARTLAGDRYDFVDIDAFGSGSQFVADALDVTKIGGLMYLTSTDGRTYSGREPQRALRQYGSFMRSHPSVQEQGLRLLLGNLVQQAAQRNLGIEPIFSFFWGDTCRVMARLTHKPTLTELNYGFLGYCHHCGNYHQPTWKKLSQAVCPHDDFPLTLSGALWLGKLHNADFLSEMAELAKDWQWPDVVKLLTTMQSESEFPPYFFPLKEIGYRGKLDLPPLDQLLTALQTKDFQSSRTHIQTQAIKTNASMQEIVAIILNISRIL
ncbi:N(2),N(2)-dimethylguanosine tRNA methyltransferase [[Leptolyngbya] sp. PCC 7376]|uniref:N(2),N(2)-dimethylguanosine tRNA methyltransferase n=1 Tax=[Leptolyngbya] sp. PCC 7376 TaxID=111781 RepID=UPI00029EE494|nr:N(2),N(2)-dimethylguanosine tRNA methyltransferase [[Leptolyngbya] sp. PCC 7376]AFY38437.1 N(2),N(2)-dimethylguanosine tRNA methyltransferase [[Leptolyngbya] sp. PCC 7376]